MRRLFALLFLLTAATGCAGFSKPMPRGYDRTVQVYGGLCPDQACLDRAQRVLDRLIGPNQDIQVEIVGTAAPRAFAWSSGHLLVSCGLAMDPANEQLLAAALAHECGHLLDDGHMDHHAPYTLTHGRAHAETRADRIGVQLLARAGYDPAAMAQLLADLETDPDFPPAQRGVLRERIADLRDAGLAVTDRAEPPRGMGTSSPGLAKTDL